MGEDESGFGVFVSNNVDRLQRGAWLLTGDWDSAQDLVQASLEKVWRRWPKIAHSDARLAYTRQVMMSTFLAWRRRRWIGELATERLPDLPAAADPFDASDTRSQLVRMINRLPRQRAVVVLRYFDDLSETATAQILGCSTGTVKSHAARALATLRSMPAMQTFGEQEQH